MGVGGDATTKRRLDGETDDSGDRSLFPRADSWRHRGHPAADACDSRCSCASSASTLARNVMTSPSLADSIRTSSETTQLCDGAENPAPAGESDIAIRIVLRSDQPKSKARSTASTTLVQGELAFTQTFRTHHRSRLLFTLTSSFAPRSPFCCRARVCRLLRIGLPQQVAAAQ